jgi:hypothetical protein
MIDPGRMTVIGPTISANTQRGHVVMPRSVHRRGEREHREPCQHRRPGPRRTPSMKRPSSERCRRPRRRQTIGGGVGGRLGLESRLPFTPVHTARPRVAGRVHAARGVLPTAPSPWYPSSTHGRPPSTETMLGCSDAPHQCLPLSGDATAIRSTHGSACGLRQAALGSSGGA